jgi:hypothetical protein
VVGPASCTVTYWPVTLQTPCTEAEKGLPGGHAKHGAALCRDGGHGCGDGRRAVRTS